MKRLFKIFLFLVCCFSLITSFSQFQKTSLSKIHWSEWKWFEHEKEDLSVSFRVYSRNECKELLSKDLVSRGYQPIQIDIVNPTAYEYEISPIDISLPSEKSSNMAFKVMKSTIPRSILFKVAGLVFWPVNIVGMVDSLNSFTSYEEMRTDWHAMTIHPNEKVPPFSTLHRVIFVPEASLAGSFTIQLKNVKSGEYETFESHASIQHLVQMQNGGIKFEGAHNGIPITALSDGTFPEETKEVLADSKLEIENIPASHLSSDEIQVLPANTPAEQSNNQHDKLMLCALDAPVQGSEIAPGPTNSPQDPISKESGTGLEAVPAAQETKSDLRLVSQSVQENPASKVEGDKPESREAVPVVVASQVPPTQPENPNEEISIQLIPLNVVKMCQSVLCTSTI